MEPDSRVQAFGAALGAALGLAFLALAFRLDPRFAALVTTLEASAFLLVLALGGVARWRVFLTLLPVVWFVASLLLPVFSPHAYPLFPIASICLVTLGCNLPRLWVCLAPDRRRQPVTRPPAACVATLALLGPALGLLYARLLTSGTIDAWDVDVARQHNLQGPGNPIALGFLSGLASAALLLLVAALTPARGGRDPILRGALVPTLLLAAALLLGWATRLDAALHLQGQASNGGTREGVRAFARAAALATPAAWALTRGSRDHAATSGVPTPRRPPRGA